jgi:hypothetical protein
MANFLENGTPMIICVVLNGLVFGWVSFLWTALFCIGRIAHMAGYSSATGFGPHAIGFAIGELSKEVHTGMLMIVFLVCLISYPNAESLISILDKAITF